MEKSVKITAIIVSAVVVIAVITAYIVMQYYPASANTLSSQGSAQVKAVPDLVTVYFNIQTTGETAKEAKDKNSEIADKAVTNLVKAGFERKDIVTENFNVYPEYSWQNGESRIKGYAATHSLKIQIKTENKDMIGKSIDAGVDAGANIGYINFELSQEKQNGYKAEALKLATEDARIKAEAIASGLGKKLGRIVSVSDSSFDYYPWRVYDAVPSAGAEEAKTAATNIQPGEQEINARVSVVYKI